LRVHEANTCAGIKETRRTKSKENIMDKFGRKKIEKKKSGGELKPLLVGYFFTLENWILSRPC
jgi:hypothetical protein